MNTPYRDQRARTRLEDIRIAAPCTADWNAMEGDDRVRFCGTCQKHVYDLSQLNRFEAEELVAAHDGPAPCVRLYRRRDGTVLTNDCPVGRKRRRLRRVVAASLGGAVLAGAMLLRWRARTCSRPFENAGKSTSDRVSPISAIAWLPADGASALESLQLPVIRERDFRSLMGVVAHDRRAETPSDRGEKLRAAPVVKIRDVALHGIDDTANASRVVGGMAAGMRRCINREIAASAPDGTSATTRDGAIVRMRIEIGKDGDVTRVTRGLAQVPPATAGCMNARAAAAHFAETTHDNASIDVEVKVESRQRADVELHR